MEWSCKPPTTTPLNLYKFWFIRHLYKFGGCKTMKWNHENFLWKSPFRMSWQKIMLAINCNQNERLNARPSPQWVEEWGLRIPKGVCPLCSGVHWVWKLNNSLILCLVRSYNNFLCLLIHKARWNGGPLPKKCLKIWSQIHFSNWIIIWIRFNLSQGRTKFGAVPNILNHQ